ncbi:MAG TPA: VanZ family protein [Desulfitobacteriaceae bacterium]|nr:VanZ family protein [Desulfitobacteriaceae bacterium]
MSKRRKLLILLSWTAVLLWLGLIFRLSSQAADQSGALSTGLTQIIVGMLVTLAPESNFDISQFDHLVRKYAHFTAYLVLSVLVINAKRRSGLKGWKWLFLALAFCLLYAVSDEIHQLYVPGRSGQIRDILIDGCGVLVGSIIYKSGSFLRARRPQAAVRKT